MVVNKKIDIKFSALVAIIFAVALSRLVPSMPNFSPMAAIALFGAVHFDQKWKSILVIFLATFFSDLVLNNTIYSYMNPSFTIFYDGFIWQYLAYAVIVILGAKTIPVVNFKNVLVGSLVTTVAFFIITNFGAWLSLPIYTKDLAGLTSSYLSAIPFLKASFMSDLLYSLGMFGGYYILQQRYSQFRLPYIQYSSN